MSPELIHVRPTDTGTWLVHPESSAEPVSSHDSETAAEAAAAELAARHGDARVVIRDRYSRPHGSATQREKAAARGGGPGT